MTTFRESIEELGHSLRFSIARLLRRLEDRLAELRFAITPEPRVELKVGDPFAAWRYVGLEDVGKASTHLALEERLEELARAAGVELEPSAELVIVPASFGFDYAAPRRLLLESRIRSVS